MKEEEQGEKESEKAEVDEEDKDEVRCSATGSLVQELGTT